MLLLPRLRAVFAGRLYIHPLEEAGKHIFQEIFVLFRRRFSSTGVNNNIYTASSINTRPPDDVVSLVQGQILVANHSLTCSFVLFPCTRMLVFNWTRTRSQWSIITGHLHCFTASTAMVSWHEWQGRQSIPKSGGTDSKLGRSGDMIPEIFLKFWYTEKAFPAYWRHLYKIYSTLTNVHDLKSIFNHVRNPLKNKVVQVW
jgi:hypothetical protein